jgi:Ca-activated chloride channel family protein
MVWFRSFGIAEALLSASFLILYGAYLYRTRRMARALHSPYSGIFIKVVPRTLFIALVIVAILGPSFGEMRREVKAEGKDIFIAVDLSRSMDAFDVAPSRIEKVKFELKNIVKAFTSDRMGLIIFGSESFIQCPLTFDQNALALFIETMNTGLVPSSGTDFGGALRVAINKFSQDQKGAANPSSKVLILISDGEDFGEDTEEALQAVEDAGIRLFTLGVGTEKGSAIPGPGGYKTDRNGQTVTTRLNTTSLRRMATLTGGEYFEISASRNDVARLINRIGSIQGEVRDARQVDVSANRYLYFLVAALALFVVDMLTSVKTLRI